MEIVKILSTKENSVVTLVKNNGTEYVIKYYREYCRSLFIELNILATCNHKNIISFVYLDLQSSYAIGICMEKQEHNLLDIILEGTYPDIVIDHYLKQIATGLQYLHLNHIIHCDLKSENIMITDSICKIIDFDLSEYIFDNVIRTTQMKYTATHRAPEAYNSNIISYFSDIWSYGMIAFELFSRQAIYNNSIFPSFVDSIDYDLEMYNFSISPKFQILIKQIMPAKFLSCLDIDPIVRPDINTIMGTDNSGTMKMDTRNEISIDLDIKGIDMFPQYIEYAIYDLSHRLDVIYYDQIIYICSNFFICIDIVPNKQYINEIISLTNGILFQYLYYVYNCDPWGIKNRTIKSSEYLIKSYQLGQCMKKTNN